MQRALCFHSSVLSDIREKSCTPPATEHFLQLQSTLTISVSLSHESFNRNGISSFHARSQKPTTLRYVFRNQANCFANSPSLYIHPYTSLCLQRCSPFVDSCNFCCKFVIVRVQTHLSSPPHEEMSTTTSTTIIL